VPARDPDDDAVADVVTACLRDRGAMALGELSSIVCSRLATTRPAAVVGCLADLCAAGRVESTNGGEAWRLVL
jgi:hypothetical protein